VTAPEVKEGGKTYRRRVCRECGKILDRPFITIQHGAGLEGRRVLQGGNSVHISCLFSTFKTTTIPLASLPDLLKEYEEKSRDPVKVLREKVRDLEERLAMAQQTIANLQPSTR